MNILSLHFSEVPHSLIYFSCNTEHTKCLVHAALLLDEACQKIFSVKISFSKLKDKTVSFHLQKKRKVPHLLEVSWKIQHQSKHIIN